MKKIISLIIAVLVLVSCFSFSACAAYFDEEVCGCPETEYAEIDENVKITFSDDYKVLYLGDQKYVRYVGDIIAYDGTYYEVENSVELTGNQTQEIENVQFTASKKGAIIDAELCFIDNSNLTASYMNEKYYEKYISSDNEKSQLIVDFLLMNDIFVKTNTKALCGEKTVLKNFAEYYSGYDEYSVVLDIVEGEFGKNKGAVIKYKDEWYYADSVAYGKLYDWYFEEDAFDLEVYKITDETLIKELDAAEERYYSEDFGILLNDEITEAVANVLVTIIFAIIPLAVLVLFAIKFFKATKTYKNIYGIICALCVVELIVYWITSNMIFK